MVREAVGTDSSKDRDHISCHIQKTERELDVGRCNKLSKPVYIGDTITARAEVIKVEDEKRLLTLATTCLNQHGEIVLDGEGVMKLPKKERNR